MNVEIVTQPGVTQTPKNCLEFTFFRGDQENSDKNCCRDSDPLIMFERINFNRLQFSCFIQSKCSSCDVTQENRFFQISALHFLAACARIIKKEKTKGKGKISSITEHITFIWETKAYKPLCFRWLNMKVC